MITPSQSARLAQRDRIGKLLGVSGRCDRIASNFMCGWYTRYGLTRCLKPGTW